MINEEMKLSLVTHKIIFYPENLEDSTIKLLALMSSLRKFSE